MLTLPIVRELVSEIMLVDEAHLERAVNAYLTLQKTMAEGAGAAGLAAMLAKPERFRGRKVGLILCGGNIDPRILASVMVRELEREDRIVSFRLTIPDRPGVLGQIATRLGRARRQYSRGRAPAAVPRCAGQGRQARRDGGNARSGARARRFSRRWRPKATSRYGSTRATTRMEIAQARAAALRRGCRHVVATANDRLRGCVLREKELRIALVCFGGISLAVYMHGISKEILKLVRASSALHAHRGPLPARAGVVLRPRRSQATRNTTPRRSISSCCARSAARVELRVIVDIIAGASAGGINGTMLARALSHDLPMEALRDLWLENADVDVLLSPEARAGRWSKWFLQPLIWAAARDRRVPRDHGPGGAAEAVAVRALALVQAAARRPRDGRPDVRRGHLDGRGARTRTASLLPSGQSLDLFVTLTDYYGYQQLRANPRSAADP